MSFTRLKIGEPKFKPSLVTEEFPPTTGACPPPLYGVELLRDPVPDWGGAGPGGNEMAEEEHTTGEDWYVWSDNSVANNPSEMAWVTTTGPIWLDRGPQWTYETDGAFSTIASPPSAGSQTLPEEYDAILYPVGPNDPCTDSTGFWSPVYWQQWAALPGDIATFEFDIRIKVDGGGEYNVDYYIHWNSATPLAIGVNTTTPVTDTYQRMSISGVVASNADRFTVEMNVRYKNESPFTAGNRFYLKDLSVTLA